MRYGLTIAIFAGFPLMAQAPPSNAPGQAGASRLKTGTLSNGRAWGIFADAEKKSYLLGLSEGIVSMLGVFPDTGDYLKEQVPQSLSIIEVSKALDRFYAEPENLPVPVIRAMHIVALKTMGLEPDRLEREVALERRLANDSAK